MRKTRSEIQKHKVKHGVSGSGDTYEVTVTIPKLTITYEGPIENYDGFFLNGESEGFDELALFVQDEGIYSLLLDHYTFGYGDYLRDAIEDSSYAIEVKVAD